MSHREDGERLNERKQTFAPSGYHGEKKKKTPSMKTASPRKNTGRVMWGEPAEYHWDTVEESTVICWRRWTVDDSSARITVRR